MLDSIDSAGEALEGLAWDSTEHGGSRTPRSAELPMVCCNSDPWDSCGGQSHVLSPLLEVVRKELW